MKEKIIGKLLSGRWLMTVGFTVTTCYLAWTGGIEAKDFLPLATIVAAFYFSRPRKEDDTNA